MTAPWPRSAMSRISSPTRSSTPWCGSIRGFSTLPRAASRTPPGSPRRTRASGGRSSRRTASRSAKRSARSGRRSITSTGSSRAGMRRPSKPSSTASAGFGMACGEDPRHASGAPAPRRRRAVKGRGTQELVVTIDGPAGAGKSATARALAQRLGYRLVDTGALYRALAWAVSAAGVDPGDPSALAAVLERTRVELVGDRVLVDGRDVSGEIRTPEISRLTSELTALAPVREKMTPLQRELAVGGGVILEGRDTGTVV